MMMTADVVSQLNVWESMYTLHRTLVTPLLWKRCLGVSTGTGVSGIDPGHDTDHTPVVSLG